MSNIEKSILLTPSWKAFFWRYFFGVLLIPVVIGIVILWKTRQKHTGISYKITDQQITITEGKYSQNIDLADIRKATPGELKFGVGSIIIKTRGREVEMFGLNNPKGIAKSIEKAAEAEKRRLEAEKQAKPREVKFDPGTMDRLDYLTGLWQQGLISEEDFKKERKNLQ